MYKFQRNNISNSKKILCYNILNNKPCNYGPKCMYAHDLADQKIEPYRDRAYKILQDKPNISDLDLISDHTLFDTFLQLTRVCGLCNKNNCPGGYNCRNGAISEKYHICYDDLIYGSCKKKPCELIHLTDLGLIPYTKQQNNSNYPNFKYKNLSNIKGELLSDNFFVKYFGNQNINPELSSDSDLEENIQNNIKFLNSDEI